jgi:hypothetical protein
MLQPEAAWNTDFTAALARSSGKDQQPKNSDARNNKAA